MRGVREDFSRFDAFSFYGHNDTALKAMNFTILVEGFMDTYMYVLTFLPHV